MPIRWTTQRRHRQNVSPRNVQTQTMCLLEMYNLPRQNQEEIQNMNTPITSNETEQVILKTLNKSKGPDSFKGGFYETFREKSTAILLNLFQKIAEGTLTSMRS